MGEAAVPPLSEVGRVEDAAALNYVANSYIYVEAPNSMVVTCRGAGGGKPALWKVPGFRESKNAGVSVYDLADPAAPRLAQRWDAPGRVEGQDRLGATLVVTNISSGELYVFDADDVAAGPVGRCDLSENGALHVRLYAHELSGRVFAVVTSGFATRHGVPGRARALIAVDVTDPARPTEVAKTRDGVPFMPEGIFVHKSRGYVGGVNDTKLSSYDLTGLAGDEPAIKLLTMRDAYPQCVAQNTGAAGAADTMYAALWANPGGLGVFDVSAADGSAPDVALLLSPGLAMTNRVVLHRGHALLPLESRPGGVAVVHVADHAEPRLLGRSFFTGPGDTCYCACAHGEHVYAFAALACAMHVFRVPELAGKS